MIFQTKDKQIKLTIDSYEFPYDEDSNYEDNNWLNLAVETEDEVLVEQAISPCLLTWELQELCEGLSKALTNHPYESAFTEPDLTVAITMEQQALHMEITYAKPGRSRFYISGNLSKAQLDEMVTDLHQMCIAYPIRKKKLLN